MIDVSVIIPTFNRLWCLPEAVASCRQNECRTEIIVVDDGSTDGTWEWLRTQADVIAVRQQNWGQNWAQNKGFATSRGEYVRFLDSDDWLPPRANDVQLATVRANSADVGVSGLIVVDQVTGRTQMHEWVDCDDFVAQQLGECDSSHYGAYLFRREFISDIPLREEFAFRQDRMFVIEVALKQPRLAVCREPCLLHRSHLGVRLQSSAGMRLVVTDWQHLRLYKKSLAMLDAQGELTLRRKRAAINVLWPLAHSIARSHPAEAHDVVDWIYRLDPDFRPPEPGMLGALYRHFGFAATQRVLALRRRLWAAPLRAVRRRGLSGAAESG